MNRGTQQTQSRRSRRPAAGSRHRQLTLENLESRQLLAAAIGAGTFVAPRNVGTVQAFQVVEVETANQRGVNDVLQTAQAVPLGTGTGQQHTVDIRGNLPPFRQGSPLTGTLNEDVDFYSFNLKAGDILDISTLGGAGSFDVFLGNGNYWFGTEINQAAIAVPPPTSPLMTIGNAVGAQVVPQDGTYYLRIGRANIVTNPVGGVDSYAVGLRVYRPVLEQQPIGTQQKIFLDFDGAVVPGSVLPPGLVPGTIRIPSLADSLTLLNLLPSEEDALISRVVAETAKRFESLVTNGSNGDFASTGIPGQYSIQVLNSRDNPDPGNDRFTTRVFIGGSTADLGVTGVYGISSTLDIGNFDTSDVVFLPVEYYEQDVLLVPNTNSTSVLDKLGVSIASVVAHEVAHAFGSRHTDFANAVPSLSDAGGIGSFEQNALGVGTDGIFGTADDIKIGFARVDRFIATEGFYGNHWVAPGLSWALSTGRLGSSLTGTVFNDFNRDGVQTGGSSSEPGLGGITVFADANGNGQLDAGEIRTQTTSNGSYSLPVGSGSNLISLVAPSGFVFTTASSRTVTGAATNVNFGLFKPATEFSGRKFADVNGNGFLDSGEPGIAGSTIYIDLDNDVRIDIGEPRATTDANGNYRLSFAGLPAGTYFVREVVSPGFEATSPAGGFYRVVYDGLNPPVGLDFGNRPSRDYGDAPNSYQTTVASNGPSHGIVAGLSLGSSVDRDRDGQPSASANADDLNGVVGAGGPVDDEDGIRLLTPLAAASVATFEINVTNTTGQTAYVQAWFDFNKNGRFTDAGEQVLKNVVLPAGSNIREIPIPAGVQTGDLFTRWRLSTTPDLGVGGSANNGEVEDHLFTVQAQPKVANDDLASVSRNSAANPINVLANDFETADNRLRISGIDRFSLGTRGQVTIAPDGRSVFYTPPNGFVGQDRFTYTVTPDFGPPATATVTINVTYQNSVPVAIDDSFEVAQGSSNVALNVLDNDLSSTAGGITIVSVTPGTQGGLTSLAGGNQSVRYTPRGGFAGTEQFTYTISDPAGNISSATVTVNLMPGARQDDVVAFGIQFLDVNNLTPISNIQAGDDFLARVTVQDVRAALSRTGVYSAFLDLLYTQELVSVVSDQSNPLGFDVDFGSLFYGGISGVQSGDANTPGLINEIGSQRLSLQTPTTNEGPIELFTMRFQAVAPGIAVFGADPADDPINETTVYNRNTAMAIRELRLGISELIINPSGEAFTSAIDDAYPNGLDSLGNRIQGGRTAQLDVLRNDLLGTTGQVSEFFIVTQPNFGTASVSNGVATYTPDGGVVNRFDSFTYGIVTADGVRSTAEVTLFVGDPAQATNAFDVDIKLQIVDVNGNPISQVVRNSRFGVQVIVQDLRSALAVNPRGVYAAYTDLLYDAGLAVPSNTILDDAFDFDVVFGPQYNASAAFGEGSRLGVIDEFGSFLTTTDLNNPALTGNPILLATLFFEAKGTGNVRFVSSPADASPFRDTLLFEPPQPVPVPRIRFNVAQATIVSGGSGEGERHNAFLPADVNSDGLVTPIDALLVLNQIGTAGQLSEGESAADRPQRFPDVNNDGQITALDALLVINYLSQSTLGGGGQGAGSEGEGEGFAADEASGMAIPSASGSRAVDFGSAEQNLLLGFVAPPAAATSDDEQSDDSWLALLADDVANVWG